MKFDRATRHARFARCARGGLAIRFSAICLVYTGWIAGTASLLIGREAMWLLAAAIGTAAAAYLAGSSLAYFLPVFLIPAFFLDGGREPHDPSMPEPMIGVLLSPLVWLVIFLSVFFGLAAASRRKPAQSG